MLNSYGKPEYDKPADDSMQKRINYNAPLDHLRRFGCHVSQSIPERQHINKKFGPKN
jgi:hypothetical protein